MRLTVVTPWLNHRELERDYWAAMRNADVEVIVVDNGSVPPLPNAWRLGSNRGFAHACNVGLQLARTEAVLFLNNDIAPLLANWHEQIVDALEPGVLVGAELRFDPHGDALGIPLPYLDGWCLAGTRDDLTALGGFDETYQEPSYYGDNDLCLRAREAGMTLREARVPLTHKRNATAGPSTDLAVRRATEANRARFHKRVAEIFDLEAVAA